MAIAFDAGTYSQSNTATSLTFSHTTAGSDRLLVVMGQDGTGVSSTVTGITYGGVAMTKALGVRYGYDRWITLWYLANPTSGANYVVVTSSSSQNMRFHALSYTGVDQSAPEDAAAVGNDDTSSSNTIWSNSITTATDGAWAVLIGKDGQGGRNYTVTSAGNSRLLSDPGGHWVADTGEIVTAGSRTLNGTVSANSNEKSIIWAFKPAGGGGGGVVTPRFLGFSRL